MKKEDILKVFTDNEIEIAEDKQSAILGELNRLSGLDVTNAKKDYDEVVKNNESLTAELDKYKKGEYIEKAEYDKLKANQIDTKELDELRKFKQDTEAKQIEGLRKETIIKELNGKFAKEAVDLIYLAAKDKAQFNDKNELQDKEAFLKDLEDTYSSFKVIENVSGAKPAVVNNSKVEKQPDNLTDALTDYYKKGDKV